jgi:FdhE protein
LKPLTREGWLEAHPYLQPVAKLCATVARAAEDIGAEMPDIPDWGDYAAEFREGVPLLQSAGVAMDFEPAGRMAALLSARLASDPPAGQLEAEASTLDTQLRREPDSPRRVAAWLLGDESFTPSSPGLLRYLGWTAAARYLTPVVEEFGRWREEERWLRRYCPTCGSLPAMAQLIGVDPGRQRFLSCGRCGTRWRYGRTACPFCEHDAQRLDAVAVEGEGGLRIDYCGSCRGYLKTYDGSGYEDVLLADWTSLHLDLVARDRGLKRQAVSLYDLAALTDPPAEPAVTEESLEER